MARLFYAQYLMLAHPPRQLLSSSNTQRLSISINIGQATYNLYPWLIADIVKKIRTTKGQVAIEPLIHMIKAAAIKLPTINA